MLKNILLIILSLFFISGCSQETKYNDQHDLCPKVTDKILKTCQQQNGVMQKQGKAQCYICTIEYSDAGKKCQSSSDCEGGCYAFNEPVPIGKANQFGQCASNNSHFGCHQKIENGVAKEGMLCVD